MRLLHLWAGWFSNCCFKMLLFLQDLRTSGPACQPFRGELSTPYSSVGPETWSLLIFKPRYLRHLPSRCQAQGLGSLMGSAALSRPQGELGASGSPSRSWALQPQLVRGPDLTLSDSQPFFWVLMYLFCLLLWVAVVFRGNPFHTWLSVCWVGRRR